MKPPEKCLRACLSTLKIGIFVVVEKGSALDPQDPLAACLILYYSQVPNIRGILIKGGLEKIPNFNKWGWVKIKRRLEIEKRL